MESKVICKELSEAVIGVAGWNGGGLWSEAGKPLIILKLLV